MTFQDPKIAEQKQKRREYKERYLGTPKGLATDRRYRQNHRLMFVLASADNRARKANYALVDRATIRAKPLDGRCEHCGKEPGKLGLCLDHDHVTGRFRGWLCARCNLAFGAFGDNEAGLTHALAYVRFQLPVQQLSPDSGLVQNYNPGRRN